MDGVCTRCGAADPDYKPELTYTYTDTVVAPTCTEQGYTLHTCNEDAGRSFKDSYTAPLGHEFDGKNLGAKCIRCHTDLFVFSHTVEATCQDGGCDVYVSILDPNDIRMNNFTDPLDHHFVDGVCTECGAKDDSYHPSYGDNYDRTYYNNTIASLTNQARTDRGQSALRYASEYQAAADTRAQELITSFSHTRPDGTNPETALDALGAEYDAFGENIAYVSAMYKPSKIVDNWIASPGHFTNMMNGSYDSFVVGTACDGTYVYAVQIFFSAVDDASLTLSEETENTAPALPAAEPEADAGKEAAPTEETAPAEEAADNTVILPEQETPAPEATAETLPAQDGEEAADVDTGSGLTEETPAPEAAPETAPETGPESAAETVPAPQAPAEPPEAPAEPAAPVEPAEPTPGDEVSEEPAAGPEVSGDVPADTPVQEAPAEGQAE